MNSARRVDISEPAILIKIPKLYRSGMSDLALYEATRAAWRLGPRRDRALFALAVVGGIVVEVFEIERWQPAGTDPYRERPLDPGSEGRWEFVGSVAPDPLRNAYRGRSVAHYFRRGNQSPVLYVNC